MHNASIQCALISEKPILAFFNGKRTHCSPNTISTKLYLACLPYVLTAPPNTGTGDGIDGAGAASTGGRTMVAAAASMTTTFNI